MDDIGHEYNKELLKQRERIQNIKKKLQKYNKNIERQEGIFNNLIKYTDGFIGYLMQLLKFFETTKKFSLFNECTKVLLADETSEMVMPPSEPVDLIYEKKLSERSIRSKRSKKTNQCAHSCGSISSMYSRQMRNQMTSRYIKSGNRYRNNNRTYSCTHSAYSIQRSSFIEFCENVYNLNQPYDTVAVNDLYKIYIEHRKQKHYLNNTLDNSDHSFDNFSSTYSTHYNSNVSSNHCSHYSKQSTYKYRNYHTNTCHHSYEDFYPYN